MPQIEIVDAKKDDHGEGPVWLDREQALVWADVYDDPSIQRYEPATGSYCSTPMPRITSCLAPRREGGLVAGMLGGFYLLDDSGDSTLLVNPDLSGQELLNDCKCDPAGRFWCATLSRDMKTPLGRLLRIDPDGSWRQFDGGYLTGNGMAFSPAADRLYVADTRSETVWTFDFDLAAGTVHNKRVFLSTLDMLGRVDGATVDSEGNYWCALVDGWAVIAVDPSGKIVERIELPVQLPTMCTFGGRDLDVLYVTSSRRRLDEAQRASQPASGRLLAIHGLGARGLPAAAFAG
ncbi:MAG TPA: SMP-30/gluconolactonase/LRE family protein [Devosia sp.]|nr:SMP-30/gluconolactonase/LRE family protein [Devosia sp.]